MEKIALLVATKILGIFMSKTSCTGFIINTSRVFFSYFYLAHILQIVYYNFINTGVDKLLQKESKTLILATDEL